MKLTSKEREQLLTAAEMAASRRVTSLRAVITHGSYSLFKKFVDFYNDGYGYLEYFDDNIEHVQCARVLMILFFREAGR